MSRKLSFPLARVQSWPQLACQTGYSVAALAKSAKVSVRTLERLLLPAFGETPRRWLKRLRMQHAIELLRDGSNISETAFRLGYEDPSHFSREFKSHYGLAPSKYSQTRVIAAQLPKCRIRP